MSNHWMSHVSFAIIQFKPSTFHVPSIPFNLPDQRDGPRERELHRVVHPHQRPHHLWSRQRRGRQAPHPTVQVSY